MNNTTATSNATGIEDGAEDEDEIILSAGTHTAFTVIIGTALPMGLLLELLLIVKLLRKEERRIWDVLMLALEGRKAVSRRLRSVIQSLIFGRVSKIPVHSK